MDQKLSTSKKLAAAGIAVGVAVASFGLGAALLPRTIIKEVPKEIIKEIPGPVQIKEVPGPIQQVKVDSGNLLVLEKELLDKEGSVEYLTDGLKDSQVDQIVDRLVTSQEWEKLAVDTVKDRAVEELNKETVNGTQLRASLMRSLFIDPEDVTFETIDFRDGDATILVPFRLRQDDQKFEGTARVLISENKLDDIFVDEIHESS